MSTEEKKLDAEREQRLNAFAIELLEYFVTLSPTEEQIKSLEMILLNYFETEYGLIFF